MNSNDWGINEYTPACLAFVPAAIHEKVEYLRWMNTLLDVTKKSDVNTEKYRHNLFESWIVFFWSYVESFTEELSNEIESIMYVSVRRIDLKSKSKFDSVFKYLTLVCNESFPSKILEENLNQLRTIRNMCAHDAGGRIESQKEGDRIGKHTYVEFGGGFQNCSNAQANALRQLGVSSVDGTYRLDLEFCEKFVKFSVDFLRELIQVSNSICERVDRFKK